MMQQIEDISRRTTDGMNVKFAWGGNAWPVTWYFRDLTNATFFAGNPTPQALNDAVVVYASNDIQARVEPLLEDRYYKFEWIRMWWPDQDYFYLTGQRVLNALDFSPSNTQCSTSGGSATTPPTAKRLARITACNIGPSPRALRCTCART
jgi:hypothetical protein